MVLPFRVPLQIPAGAVDPAGGGEGAGVDARAEVDDGYEAVAARAVPLLRSGIRARRERGERAPARVGEADRDARLRVVELRLDLVGDPLEAVDLAPLRFPR